MEKLWSGLGSTLAKPEAFPVPAPAVAFWAAGLAAWVSYAGTDELTSRWDSIKALSPVLQAAVLAGVLALLVGSSLVVGVFELPVLRLLEGYWPRWAWLQRLGRRLVAWQSSRIDRDEARWQELARRTLDQLGPDEQHERAALDQRLRLAPSDAKQRMPTALGNILRAAERRPREKYGLDSIICWPRLWLLLPDASQKDLTGARAQLDLAVRALIWGGLFIGWVVLAWWALPVGLIVIALAYRRMLQAAEVYGDLLESAFDVHRFALYEALRWPPPERTSDESELGARLTEYLFRGTTPYAVEFKHPIAVGAAESPISAIHE